MSKLRESRFQIKIVESLIHMKAHPVEIPDDAKKVYKFGDPIHASAKPYDVGALDKSDRYAALELKVNDSPSWSFSKLTESEKAGLGVVSRINKRAWILIHFNFRTTTPQMRKRMNGLEVVDQVWALNYLNYEKMLEAAHVSLPLEHAKRLWAREIPKLENGLWDLRGLWKPV